MRENRPYGSEGGEGHTFPTPIAMAIHERYSDDGKLFPELCRLGRGR